QRAGQHEQPQSDRLARMRRLHVGAVHQEDLHQGGDGFSFELPGPLPEGSALAGRAELLHGAVQGSVRPVGGDHVAHDLGGEHRQRNLPHHAGLELLGDVVALAFQHAQDGGLDQGILVAETAVDRGGGQAGVGSDAGQRRPFHPVLAQHFDRGLEQLAQRFAAAGLLRLQLGFGKSLGHAAIVVALTKRKCEFTLAFMAAPNPAAPLRPHPLRQPWFRRLWIGRTISLLGDQCYFVALPWLVLQLTGSALAMGTVLMAAAVPRVVLMLLGGAISDRVSARRVMMAAAAARALLVAAVGGLLSLHRLRLADLYLLAFCFGVADAFGLPAGSAYLPAIVEPEQLVAANSVQQATVQATSLAGPAPAGWVMAAWGTAWAFYLDAISFLFIIGALMGLPDPPLRPKIAAAKRASMLASVGEGLRHVRGDAPLTAFMLLAAMINFCVAGPIGVGLAYLAKVRFN